MQPYDEEDPISQFMFNPRDPVRTTTILEDPSNCRRKLNQYICGQKVGKGKHGDVYICQDEAGGPKLVCFSFFLLVFVSMILLRRSKLLDELILAIKSNY